MATKKKSSPSKKSSSTPSFNIEAAANALPESAGLQDAPSPPAPYIRDSRRCADAAKKYQLKFKNLPDFDVAHIARAGILVDAWEDAHKRWVRLREAKADSKNKKPVRVEAETLRSDMMESGLYLFRNVPEALAELHRIREGEGIDDLVLDLRDFVKHRKAYASVWAADVRLEKNAFARAQELADALDEIVDSEEALAAKQYRNRIGMLLEASLDEIRKGARYLFGRFSETTRIFTSNYDAQRQAVSRAKKTREAKAARTKAGTTFPAEA